ncbi:MAG: DUF551 domain-containing protein [Pseudomonadota bacterium]|nr:DUF551 domain-containing protein [Pseudomonadota bacterium]
MSEWISVNDRMPEPQRDVLICQMYGAAGPKFQVVGKWIKALTEEADPDCDDWHEYDEASDEYYVPEGWYENQHNWGEFASIYMPSESVTHWMPLPGPPEAP